MNESPAASVGTEPLLAVEGLVVRYGAASDALSDIDLRVGAGEAVGILGSNGAGKTTLMRAISGTLPLYRGRAASGDIRYRGESILGRSPRSRVRQGLVQVPEGRKLFGGLTVAENLDVGSASGRVGSKRERSQVRQDVFDLFPVLADRRSQPAALLSGGEQQMLAIGRALMAGPELLMLDEPSLGLAPKIIQVISDLVEVVHGRGVALLVVEQNVDVALRLTERAYVLGRGRVATEDRSEALRGSSVIEAIYLGQDVEIEERAGA